MTFRRPLGFAIAVLSISGCGNGGGSLARSLQALPSCTGSQGRAGGVEEMADGRLIAYGEDGTALCAGRWDEIENSHLFAPPETDIAGSHDKGERALPAPGSDNPALLAASNPMPADGDHKN